MDCPFQENMGDFSVQQNISEDEDIRMLREYSSTIGKGGISVNRDNRYNIRDVKTYDQSDEPHMSSADVEVYDMSGKKCSTSDIDCIKKNGMAVLIFEIFEKDMEDAFQDEFKFWKQDSVKILTDPQLGQDDIIRFLPIKELQLEINYHLFKLTGCKMYHDYNNGKYAIIVQKITEI